MTFVLTSEALAARLADPNSSVSDFEHGPLRPPDQRETPVVRSAIEAALKFEGNPPLPAGAIGIDTALKEVKALRHELKQLAMNTGEKVWGRLDRSLEPVVIRLQRDLADGCQTWGAHSLRALRDTVVECRDAMTARADIDRLTGKLAGQSTQINRAKANVRESAEPLHRQAEMALKHSAKLFQADPTKVSLHDLANLAVKVEDIDAILSGNRPTGPALGAADVASVQSTLRKPVRMSGFDVKGPPHTVPLPGSALAMHLESTRRGRPPLNEASLSSATLGYSLTDPMLEPKVVTPKWPTESEDRSQPADSHSRGSSPRTDRR